MNLSLSHRDITCHTFNKESRHGAGLRGLSQRSGASRLRRRGPGWMLAALLLLVAANAALASFAWLIVEHIVR